MRFLASFFVSMENVKFSKENPMKENRCAGNLKLSPVLTSQSQVSVQEVKMRPQLLQSFACPAAVNDYPPSAAQLSLLSLAGRS